MGGAYGIVDYFAGGVIGIGRTVVHDIAIGGKIDLAAAGITQIVEALRGDAERSQRIACSGYGLHECNGIFADGAAHGIGIPHKKDAVALAVVGIERHGDAVDVVSRITRGINSCRAESRYLRHADFEIKRIQQKLKIIDIRGSIKAIGGNDIIIPGCEPCIAEIPIGIGAQSGAAAQR